MTRTSSHPVARWLRRAPAPLEPLHLATATGRHVVVPSPTPSRPRHARKGS